MLILGGQVLIGAAFRLTFIDGFDKLPIYSQGLHLASLWLMLIGLGILLVPAPYHFIVEGGANTRRFHELVTFVLEWTLLPFALGLGVSILIVCEQTMTTAPRAIAGATVLSVALGLWYVRPALKLK